MGRKTKYTTAVIPYQNNGYDVSGAEYVDWENELEASGVDCESDKGQWITYHFLFNLGHLVSTPKVPEPTKQEALKQQAKRDKVERESWEGTPKYVDGELWTPTRLLNEREKLIRAKEKQLEKDKKRFIQVAERERRTALASREQGINFALNAAKFYHSDGRPYKQHDYISTIVVLTLLLFFFGFLIVAFIISQFR